MTTCTARAVHTCGRSPVVWADDGVGPTIRPEVLSAIGSIDQAEAP